MRLFRTTENDRTFHRDARAPLVYESHRGKHPQSTRCHWSEQPVFKDPEVFFLGESPDQISEIFIQLAEPERKIYRHPPIPIKRERRPRLQPTPRNSSKKP